MTSLYLHLPFCYRWCSYCAFYSEEFPFWKNKRESYVRRMEAEILDAGKRHGAFETVFLGGGNPLCLEPSQLETLLSAAGRSSETTIEMNPESLQDSYRCLFSSSLVNRISMGIQSMNPHLLSVLGRNCDREGNIRGIRKAMELKEAFGTQVNFDLITCIPGQTVDDAKKDIDDILSISNPDHLSLYCLTLEKHTCLAQKVRSGVYHMIDDAGQAKMLFSLWEYLQKNGFTHYEISNFAKDGHYCKHNLRYWRLEQYLGLGCHAASRLRTQNGFEEIENTQSLASYANGAMGSGYSFHILTAEQEMEEYLITNFRTCWGVSKQEFQERFKKSFDVLFKKAICETPLRWIRKNDAYFALSEEGMMVLDTVILNFCMCF